MHEGARVSMFAWQLTFAANHNGAPKAGGKGEVNEYENAYSKG